MPVEFVEPPCGRDQVAFADDVVPLENGAGFVPRHLHRHAFGDAGANEISNGAAAKIVGKSEAVGASSWTGVLRTGRS
jgi:hypothetical protein